MKNKSFYSKILPVLIIFLFVLFAFSSFSFGFTEEQQAKINELVSTLRTNSKNQSTTWAIDDNNTKKAYFATDFDYNGTTCSYVAVMYWRDQCSVTFTDGVVVGKNVDGAKHDFNVYYFDKDLNCLGAKANSLNGGSSVSISGVKSYFYAEFTVKNSSGEVVEPFFLVPPATLEEVLKAEKTEVKTMQEILGVLPLIIVVVVSFLGLRKALRMLETFLRRS